MSYSAGMANCRACNGSGFVNQAGVGKTACQVCRGTGQFTDRDKADRASAMSSDAVGCVIGLALGCLLAFGGYKLGYQVGGSFGASNLGVKFTPDSKIALYGSIIGAAAGFLLGFALSRLRK